MFKLISNLFFTVIFYCIVIAEIILFLLFFLPLLFIYLFIFLLKFTKVIPSSHSFNTLLTKNRNYIPLVIRWFILLIGRKNIFEFILKKLFLRFNFTKLHSKRNENTFIDFSNPAIFKNKNFFHNGHLGDIIYSLSLLRSIYKKTHQKVNMYISADDINDNKFLNHPSGSNKSEFSFMISKRSFKFIRPLIEKQSFISKCIFVKRDYAMRKFNPIDLSLFRDYFINTSAGDISLYYEKLLGFGYDSSIPWLTNVKKNKTYNKKIVIGRTFRYRNESINYSFLNQLSDVLFIGTYSEFFDFKSKFQLNKIKYLRLKDSMHAAEVINSCLVYIGNQSFFFSLAEGLKSNRILESYEPSPNVICNGKNGFSFIYDTHLINHLRVNYNLNIVHDYKFVVPKFIN